MEIVARIIEASLELERGTISGDALLNMDGEDLSSKLGSDSEEAQSLLREFKGLTMNRYLQVLRANLRASVGYVPKRYPGRLTLFRCTDNIDLSMDGVAKHILPGIFRATLRDWKKLPLILPGIAMGVKRTRTSGNTRLRGWQHHTSEPVRVHDISGNHFNILNEPNVGDLAERLKESIDDAIQ
jgi:hypothetical protein